MLLWACTKGFGARPYTHHALRQLLLNLIFSNNTGYHVKQLHNTVFPQHATHLLLHFNIKQYVQNLYYNWGWKKEKSHRESHSITRTWCTLFTRAQALPVGYFYITVRSSSSRKWLWIYKVLWLLWKMLGDINDTVCKWWVSKSLVLVLQKDHFQSYY